MDILWLVLKALPLAGFFLLAYYLTPHFIGPK